MSWNRVKRVIVIAGLAVIVQAVTAPAVRAQSGSQVHWGIRATFTPTWIIPERAMDIGLLKDYVGQDSKVVGSDVAVGLVRGSRLGGDWGLTYLRRTLSDSTRLDITEADTCISIDSIRQCGPNRNVYTMRGFSLHGAELHRFVPWFTIKRRAQLGVNIGLGALVASGGTVTKVSTATTAEFDTVTRRNVLTTIQSTATLDSRGFLQDRDIPSVLPTARLELALTGIVSRNVKVRASSGISFPGSALLTVGIVYLIPGR